MNEIELGRLRVELLRAAIKKTTTCTKARPDGNQTEFGKLLGYKDGAHVRQMLSGERPVSEKTIRLIEDLPGMAGWFTGRPEFASAGAPVSVQHSSPGSYPSINAPKGTMFETAQRNHGSKILVDEPSRGYKNVVPAPRDLRHIPVISYVQAGKMTEAVDPYALGDGFETILTDLDVSERTFALIIEGTSMLPEFNEGDKVIIDPELSPRPGDFVVAKNTQEEATFKKYRPRGTGERGEMIFELVPLNDDFPTLHSERDHLHIIGVMAEHRKYRRR